MISPLFDNSDDATEEPVVDPVEVSNGETVFAGSGDTTIISDGSIENATVFGEAGNDLLKVAAGGGQLDGGAGDDIIVADGSSYALEVFGGAGNDTIDSSGAASRARIHGGGGDDVLNLDYANLGGDEEPIVDGGYGADIFNVGIDLDVNSGFDTPVPVLVGGEGADLFALDVSLGSVSIEDPVTDGTTAGLITICDFVPGTDQLQLQADGATVELVESPDGDFTDVVLTYPAVGGNPAVQGIVHLAGVTGLTMADISVQAAAA